MVYAYCEVCVCVCAANLVGLLIRCSLLLLQAAQRCGAVAGPAYLTS